MVVNAVQVEDALFGAGQVAACKSICSYLWDMVMDRLTIYSFT